MVLRWLVKAQLAEQLFNRLLSLNIRVDLSQECLMAIIRLLSAHLCLVVLSFVVGRAARILRADTVRVTTCIP